MARTKLRARTAPAKAGRKVSDENAAFGLRDYVLINLAFAGFCLLQLIIVRTILNDDAGINFFFGFLIVAFVAVSLFDYFASRLKIGDADESNHSLTAK